MKYMFYCKDISKISSEGRKLSFFEDMKFKFHIYICHDCQNFINSMRELMRLAKKNIEDKMKVNETELVKIEDEIIKRIKNN